MKEGRIAAAIFRQFTSSGCNKGVLRNLELFNVWGVQFGHSQAEKFKISLVFSVTVGSAYPNLVRQQKYPLDGGGVMRVRELSILGCGAAVAVASVLSACAAGGPTSVPPPQLLTSPPASSDTPKYASARLGTPPDSASLTEDPNEIADLFELPGEQNAVSDPFEKLNRFVFNGNQRLSHAVVYPAARAYRNTVPLPVRNSIEAFAGNLAEPMVFANNVLQLRVEAAATTLGRFAMNSTLGIGGLFDVAAKKNLPRQTGDFGQTLYVWGMRNSNYLVVPIIGPTNLRDLIGTTVEFVATIPVGAQLPNWLPAEVANTADTVTVAGSIASPVTKLDQVGQMEQLEDSSLDFYTMLRSVAIQKRQSELQEALDASGWTKSGNPETATVASQRRFPEPVYGGAQEEALVGGVLAYGQ